ncbi:SAV_915 family protein [Speluncibacter jeojiensis]
MELRGLSDGRRALPVYTSLGAFVRCCGDRQPWLAVPRA